MSLLSILFFCLFILILLMMIFFSYPKSYVYPKNTENWSQKDQHLIAHFGGTPNQSQIWPYLVKYPKQYV